MATNLAALDLGPLLDRGASVTVTPEVELQMGFGDCLAGRLRTRGAAPTIGTDIESSLGGDVFTTMRMALQSQRNVDNKAVIAATGRAPERLSVTVREALEWATINGARMLGFERRIGSLIPGKAADLVLLRADDLNLLPVIDPVSSIVLHAGIANVDTVFVAGVRGEARGRALYPELSRRQREFAYSSRRIVAEAGLSQ